MDFNWFVRKGIIYWPVSLLGWVIFVTALIYAIYLFIDIDSRSHSVSDTLINWVFNCLIIGVAYSVIGFFTEKKISE
ncbi:MAG: hypothetical protein HYR67_11120 [Bacteroidetes bacterium]|nr:hypothetical protein [Bacteroidota bacterium]